MAKSESADHPVACARFAILDRAGLPVMGAVRRQLISEATRYRSAVVIPDGSPCGGATPIWRNLSDADEDIGHA